MSVLETRRAWGIRLREKSMHTESDGGDLKVNVGDMVKSGYWSFDLLPMKFLLSLHKCFSSGDSA